MSWLAGLFITVLTMVGCPSTQTGGGNVDLPPQQASQLAAFDAALTAGDLEGARAELERVSASAAPDSALPDLLRGRLLRAEGKGRRAISAFAKASSADDGDVSAAATIYHALALAEDGQQDQARQALASYSISDFNSLVATPDRPSASLVVARALTATGQPVDAIGVLGVGLDAADRAGDMEMARHIRDKAFDLAHDVPQSAHASALETSEPLVVATVGYEAVRASVSEGQQTNAEETLRTVSPALALVGAFTRITELEQTIQLDSGGTGRALIGAVLPLTGEGRRVGRTVLAGILQAEGAFFPGGGQRLTIVFKDSASSPETAVAAVEELDRIGALAVIGPLGVDASQAAATVAAEKGLPLISLSVDSEPPAEGTYRFGIDVRLEIQALTSDAVERGQLLAVIAKPETEYGDTLAEIFAEEFTAAGGQIVKIESYPTDAVDLRELAESLAAMEFDTVFIPDNADRAVLVASFLAQENIWGAMPDKEPGEQDSRRLITYLGTSAWYRADLTDIAGRYLQGAAFPVSYAREAPSETNQLFVDTFAHLYGREPGLYEAISYDVTRLLRDLIMNRGLVSRSAIHDALQSMAPRTGVTGEFQFSKGVAAPSATLLRIDSRQLRPAEPPPRPATDDGSIDGLDDAEESSPPDTLP